MYTHTKRLVSFIQLMEEPAEQLSSILNLGYFLAVSSDSLLVINHEDEVLETIRRGVDDDGLKVGFLSLDDMLEAIDTIKQLIDNKQDVIGVIYQNATL